MSSPGLTGRPSIPEAVAINREAAAYWIPRFRGGWRLVAGQALCARTYGRRKREAGGYGSLLSQGRRERM